MIQMPTRSVTRFFIPMIDVLTLLFCIYLMMPMVDTSANAELDVERQKREDRLRDLEAELKRVGIAIRPGCLQKLTDRRAMYEPYIVGLARDMFFTLPAWVPEPDAVDNWQISAWQDPRHF